MYELKHKTKENYQSSVSTTRLKATKIINNISQCTQNFGDKTWNEYITRETYMPTGW